MVPPFTWNTPLVETLLTIQSGCLPPRPLSSVSLTGTRSFVEAVSW